MPKKAKELGALAVGRFKEPGLHFVGGVAGLALQVLATGGRSWVLRVRVGDRRRDMGLGGYPDVTLAQARDRAREARDKIRKGLDPIEEVRAAKRLLKLSQASAVTFKSAAAAYIEAHEAGWRNPKHAQQWRNTLETHAYPRIGNMLLRDIGTKDVQDVLDPIWHKKTETASRLRGRIEKILDWATTRGYREGLNPARWRGHLNNLFPAPRKVAKVIHHAALPIDEAGAFMAELRKHSGVGARALEFAILTAARSGEVRGATWGEIDLEAKVWTVPASRMKAENEHRVPLSDPANELLKALPSAAGDRKPTDFVFVAPRGGKLSDMTLNAVIRRLGCPVVQHGFRSTFRDWCSERTHYSNEVAEMALAHVIGNKTESSYRRGDLFEKRRSLMTDWARFVSKVSKPAKVIELHSKRA